MAPTLQSLLRTSGPLKFLLPAAAITGALTFGAPSAHALSNSLAFSGGNSDFFSQVNVADPTDLFTVTFNPSPLTQFVTTGSGLFAAQFPAVPGLYSVAPTTATFQWVGAGTNPFQAFYALTADALFNYTNGVTVGVFAGSVFEVSQQATSVGVVLTTLLPPDETAFVSGLTTADPVTVTGGQFTFNDTNSEGGGTYSGQVDVVAEAVPGPLPILGASVAFGFSRRLRKRVKSAATV
jgi:hypothetical protein